jgi:hypothetical protein
MGTGWNVNSEKTRLLLGFIQFIRRTQICKKYTKEYSQASTFYSEIKQTKRGKAVLAEGVEIEPAVPRKANKALSSLLILFPWI